MVFNKNFLYSSLLFLMVFSLPFGSYLLPVNVGFMTLDLYKILLCVTSFVLLVLKDFSFYSGKFTKYLFYLFLIWILFALTSFFWVIDKTLWIKEISYLLFGFLLFINLISIHKMVNGANKIFFIAWISALVPQVLFAMSEMHFGKHLPGNFSNLQALWPSTHYENYCAVTTFDNPNNLSIYLVLSVAIILVIMQIKKEHREVLTLFIVFSVLCTYINLSRFGMIAFYVLGITFFSDFINF